MTLPQLFDRSVASRPREAALTHWSPRVERSHSTQAVADRVARFAAGLISLGVKKGDRVLVLSENRPEWAIADYATMFAGGIVVPVYPSLTADQIHYILENSGACVAIASTQHLLDRLLQAAVGLRNLGQVVVIDESAAAENVMHFDSVANLGEDLLRGSPDAWREPASRLREEDVATILYTSGTTGPPKGVMLTHRNLVSNVTTLCGTLDFEPDDVALSFLPLCHVTQRLADYIYFSMGVRIVYVGMEDLAAAMSAVRPTTFPGVPRVYEKARDAVLARAAASPLPLRALLRWALAVGRRVERHRIERRDPGVWLRARHRVLDTLILSRVRRGMGGRLRYLVSGGAPLHPDIMEFFMAIGVPILEGYGLTETTVLTLNSLERPLPGTVGRPLPGVELRLEEDGEILARGAGIARGYYLDVKRTDESFRDGWFRTGDLGRLDADGNLIITGRKKELLVTSGGKKVSPSPIEQSILAHPLVSQVVLVGDGRKFVSALLVPDRARLMDRCQEMGIARGNNVTYDEVLHRPEVQQIFEQIIARSNRRLARFEQIKKFTLLAGELTQEGGELTPTLKVRRRVVEEKYRGLIESLYGPAGDGGAGEA